MTNDAHGNITRRDMLRAAGIISGGVIAAELLPRSAFAWAQPKAAADPVDQMRAQMALRPIESAGLNGGMTMLSAPGGNVVVLAGKDGKIVVDGFVKPAYPKLRQLLDGMNRAPVKVLIDTHWHFDHSDNNANFRHAGAKVVAHENTKKRLGEAHDMLGMHFNAAPSAAWPTESFHALRTISANGETLELSHVPPAHTDTDIFVHYTKANVLHVADVFFNGVYPFIDQGTGGNINGMIGAVDIALQKADEKTQIVPGHGPLADKAALRKYRDVLNTVRDRVQKLKSDGKTLAETQAAKPTAEYDATWGKGLVNADNFVGFVYSTL